MGVIRTREGKQRRLAEYMVLGRAPLCDIRAFAAEVSAEHAALRWAEETWCLVDLSSRNGTWVDGRRLNRGEAATLEAGSMFCLASPEETWTLDDASAPAPFIQTLEGDRPIQNGMIAFPSASDPQLSIMQLSDGSWIVEDDSGHRRAIADRELLRLGQQRLRLYTPSHIPPTAAAESGLISVEDAEVHVRHDLTEEHVVVVLKSRSGQRVELGSRAHNAVLLELARARLEDRGRGLDDAEEGWIHRDDLSKRLNLPVNHVNIMIFRLRRQLAELGVADAADVVERRARIGLLRIGTASLSVGSLS